MQFANLIKNHIFVFSQYGRKFNNNEKNSLKMGYQAYFLIL